jgi:uncharacterized protein (DUF58 family)
MVSIIKSIYLTRRFFQGIIALVLLMLMAYLIPFLFPIVIGLSFIYVVIVVLEISLLFKIKDGIIAERQTPKKLSNGDFNDIYIRIKNQYPQNVTLQIIDELPYQFQFRNSNWNVDLEPKGKTTICYQIKPVKRGEYFFGSINIYTSVFANLIQRRYSLEGDAVIPVYPSIVQMRKYEYAAISNRLLEFGVKKIRKVGHTMEFEQIRNYTPGDDPRSINWKASARANNLMINNYQDEKSQPVYCIIDKGRMMRFPFGGLSLLDYSINAALVMSNIALKKDDKAGIITFSNKLSSVLPASKKSDQLKNILEILYNQKTLYKESNFELLSLYIQKNIRQRSLMILFTNFESLSSFKRQLPYFIHLKRFHTLVIVFFKNRELSEFILKETESQEEIYSQAIAEEYQADKYLIVMELQKYGIYSILTYPENLTINTINKYLELKAKSVL